MEPSLSVPGHDPGLTGPDAGTGLDAVRMRRAELRETLSVLEHSLAAPASGRAVVWGEAVHDALITVCGDFGAHVEVTEGAGGLHQSILANEPRLANAVTALTDEHEIIADQIASLIDDSRAPVTDEDVDGLRDRATALLSTMLKHRQRGADMVYDAFQTDIGGAD